jgi:predicted Zn-dependent peptidase
MILSGGKASRFYQEFVRPGRAVSVDLELGTPPWTAQDPDLLVLTAVAAPGQSLAALEADLWAALARVQQDGVQSLELARAKKIVRAQAARSLAKNFYRGLLVGLFYLKTGDAQRVNGLLRRYEEVTLEDLLRVVRHYFREDNRTVVTLKPVSPEESAALGTLE